MKDKNKKIFIAGVVVTVVALVIGLALFFVLHQDNVKKANGIWESNSDKAPIIEVSDGTVIIRNYAQNVLSGNVTTLESVGKISNDGVITAKDNESGDSIRFKYEFVGDKMLVTVEKDWLPSLFKESMDSDKAQLNKGQKFTYQRQKESSKKTSIKKKSKKSEKKSKEASSELEEIKSEAENMIGLSPTLAEDHFSDMEMDKDISIYTDFTNADGDYISSTEEGYKIIKVLSVEKDESSDYNIEFVVDKK